MELPSDAAGLPVANAEGLEALAKVDEAGPKAVGAPVPTLEDPSKAGTTAIPGTIKIEREGIPTFTIKTN